MTRSRDLSYLAKNGDSTWLESSTDNVEKFKKEEKTAIIEALIREVNELDGEFGLEEVSRGDVRTENLANPRAGGGSGARATNCNE